MDTKETILDLRKSFNWYDLSVKVTGHHLFEKGYAGCVENVNQSKSDPCMGKEFI